MRKILTAIFCIATLLPISAQSVDMDVVPGTYTIEAALQQAREARRLQGAKNVTLHLQAGTYRLCQPIIIRPEDNGTSIVANGDATISGGVKITGWKKQGKYEVADVPEFNGTPLYFRQLWINGKKAVRARDVNDFESADGLVSKDHRIINVDKKNETIYVPTKSVKSILKAKEVEMVLHEMWCIANLRVKEIKVMGDSAAITFQQPESHIHFMHPWPSPMVTNDGHNSSFYFTNAKELMDEPGEWYLDDRAGKIYYLPKKGEDMNHADVEAPAMETLVHAIGTPDNPVKNITFDGVSFSYATWLRPSIEGHAPLQAGMYMTEAYKLKPKMERGNGDHKLDNQGWIGRPAASVDINCAENVWFKNCSFEHHASTGLDFNKYIKGGGADGCKFQDIGGNGILAGEFSPEGFETHLPYNPTDERIICDSLSITGNKLNDVTNEDWGCVGIGAGIVRNIMINYNEISDVSYTGISLGWGWNQQPCGMRDNHVKGNKIRHYAKPMYDTAGIYTLGNQPGSVVEDNTVSDIYTPAYVHDPEHWFYLYTDEGSSNITIRNNKIPSDKILKNANGPGNTWENNGPDVVPSQMKIRGACIGLQKPVYLPGHGVYEYPYTPENFPWFYDKGLWVKYLDMLQEDSMNAVFLWNGHPFASLVKLQDYPFAVEVPDSTLKKNEEMFSFITTEAKKRGIMIYQMFYNIILSKPFADHYGLKTQDRNRPITPLISDYTRKSIAEFIRKYPNVGLLVCLGEAMATIDDDVNWMTKTIIPGIKDGLKASNRTDMPPIIMRSHDTDGPRVLRAALPLYPHIYTMTTYTGESLTTYEPGGPWGDTQRELSSVAPLHISNVHILANLEPWRWSSPKFIQKAVQAMHRVHGANGLHLYPQASYWDWPYTADKLADGKRELQIDRDWMWYKAWGRYSANCERGDDSEYWIKTLADYYGCDTVSARRILDAYNESGEIAPKLIRRFGITEGNRQSLLLGMKISQLVNPYKYTIYPGFYESCGPTGEKLIEYVEKEWKHQSHFGELPLDIVNQCSEHGIKATSAIDSASAYITKNKDEFKRLQNDMHCYSDFAEAFKWKVRAAEQVLNYKWTKDLSYLQKAVPLLEKSNEEFQKLVDITKDTYLYANSMQTSQRRIPVGGDDGKYKTWEEMMPVYQAELNNLEKNIDKLSGKVTSASAEKIETATPAKIRLVSKYKTLKLEKGAKPFSGRDEEVDTIVSELKGLDALLLNRDTARIKGISVEFDCSKPVMMLVGFFIDDQNKFASPPKLETDATGNEFGQAESLISNAIHMKGMPMVDIHAYHFNAGHHKINLPKGIIMVAGFTDTPLKQRDGGLNGGNDEVDWLFL